MELMRKSYKIGGLRRMLEFKELEYVLAVAKHQNLTKAAQDLYISQPSLTKYLQNLEKNLDIKLFNRVGYKFIPTYAGERYIAHASDIMLMKKSMETEIIDINRRDKGRIKIAFPYVRGSYMIAATLPIFTEKYPNVEIQLFEESSAVLEKLVLSGEADIAIFNNYAQFNPKLNYEIIGKEEIALAVGREHPLSCEGEVRSDCRFPWIDLKRFKEDKFLLNLPSQRTGQIAEQIFLKANFTPANVLRIRSIDAAVRLVSVNYGLCFVTENHLKYLDEIGFGEKTCFFSIGAPNSMMDLVVVSRKNAYLPKFMHDYIDIVKKVLKNLAKTT
jgi:DNA-binding transcriptional LysR family regulator